MRLEKVEIQGNNIRVLLENGVTFNVSFNEKQIHLHASGISGNLIATGMSGADIPKLETANYLDVLYKPSKT